MDLRQIRYFVAACETGSLSGAAVRLNCTAPGVSQQMSSLEARLGTRLFERTPRGVRPTAAGSRFYSRCLAVLKAVSEAEIELQDFKAGLSGSVSAGFAPGLARTILPQVLARFTREFPRIDIEIASGTADVLVSEASAGGLDFYIGQFREEHLGVVATHMGRYPVSLISGARRGLAQMQPVDLSKLSPLKLSVPSGTNSLRSRIEEAIRTGEIVLERKISIDSLSAGFQFVSQTEWSSILPFWVGLQELGNDRVTVNPIEKPAFHVDVSLIVPTQRPMIRPAQLFYDYFRQELDRLHEEWRRIVAPALSDD